MFFPAHKQESCISGRIKIPYDSLPAEGSARHAYLRDYFCDKDARVLRTAEGWELDLYWEGDAARHVDRALGEGLEWWTPATPREGMAFAFRRRGHVLYALYDSWTLYTWSHWIARTPSAWGKNLLILHVDDHRDVAPPRLCVTEDGYLDLITGASVSIDSPDSIHAAISSGAIGMGSFLTLLLHQMPHAEVRHLCQPPKSRTTIDYEIIPEAIPDSLLRPGANRPSIRLQPGTGTGPGRYRQTPDLAAWLDAIPTNANVLLHIDMDYFNNRYDGDSDWADRDEGLDPPLENVLEKIDELGRALDASGVVNHISDTAIAFSPGFFPAELWASAASRLEARLKKLHGD